MSIEAKIRILGNFRLLSGKYFTVTLLFVIGLLVPAMARCQMTVGDIYTAAGTGTPGYNGDGILATSAEIDNPNSIAIDSSGNVYFADFSNERIRKINALTGDISTIAGNGTRADSGDGGAAASAELDDPGPVAIDSAGNLYIAEYDSVVREIVASTGIIKRIAGNGTSGFSGDGGPALSAEFSNITGLAVDASGDVFISDTGNQRVREVKASNGYVYTIAGDGVQGFAGDGSAATAAELNNPDGLAFDSSGNLYIADFSNNRVRVVSASTGYIETVAGNGTAANTGNGGLATSAAIYNPKSLAFDASGNLYIGVEPEVREVVAGYISTVAGNGTVGYSGDGGPATNAELNYYPVGIGFDAYGDLYIADNGNQRVREVYELSPPAPPPPPPPPYSGGESGTPPQTCGTNVGTFDVTANQSATNGLDWKIQVYIGGTIVFVYYTISDTSGTLATGQFSTDSKTVTTSRLPVSAPTVSGSITVKYPLNKGGDIKCSVPYSFTTTN